MYVADYTGGLIILDVADPSHPTYVDSITYDETWDVSLYGPYVVIGTDTGVHSISIGDGIRVPEHYGTYSGPYEILDVRVQNEVAFIAAGASGLLSVDVSDPTNPTKGCKFSPRCEFSMKICQEKKPKAFLLDSEHMVKCWLFKKK